MSFCNIFLDKENSDKCSFKNTHRQILKVLKLRNTVIYKHHKNSENWCDMRIEYHTDSNRPKRNIINIDKENNHDSQYN